MATMSITEEVKLLRKEVRELRELLNEVLTHVSKPKHAIIPFSLKAFENDDDDDYDENENEEDEERHQEETKGMNGLFFIPRTFNAQFFQNLLKPIK